MSQTPNYRNRVRAEIEGKNMNDNDPEIESSPLRGSVTRDDIAAQVKTYRLAGNEGGWSLEVVNQEGTSTVWHDLFLPLTSKRLANFIKRLKLRGSMPFRIALRAKGKTADYAFGSNPRAETLQLTARSRVSLPCRAVDLGQRIAFDIRERNHIKHRRLAADPPFDARDAHSIVPTQAVALRFWN
jgi:hypothetical protein